LKRYYLPCTYLCSMIKHRIYIVYLLVWLRFIRVNFLPRRYYIEHNILYVSVLFVQEAGQLQRHANGDETKDKTFLRRDPLLLVSLIIYCTSTVAVCIYILSRILVYPIILPIRTILASFGLRWLLQYTHNKLKLKLRETLYYSKLIILHILHEYNMLRSQTYLNVIFITAL